MLRQQCWRTTETPDLGLRASLYRNRSLTHRSLPPMGRPMLGRLTPARVNRVRQSHDLKEALCATSQAALVDQRARW